MLFFIYVYVSECVDAMYVDACDGKKCIRSPVMGVTENCISCPSWVLGTQLRSSRRAASNLNH